MSQWLADMIAAEGSGVAAGGVLLLLLLGVYAQLILKADRLPPWLRRTMPSDLRSRFTIILVLATALPAISLALVLSDRATRQRFERAADSLKTEANGTARGLQYLVGKARDSTIALADEMARAGAFEPASALPQLQLHHAETLGVESMMAIRQDGSLLAATVRDIDGPVPFDAKRLKDSVFLQSAMRSSATQISGTEEEPLLHKNRALLVTAPVYLPDGTRWGLVMAAFVPASLTGLQSSYSQELVGGVVIADRNLNVLLAAEPSEPVLLTEAMRKTLLTMPSDKTPFRFDLASSDGRAQSFIGSQATATDGLFRVIRFASAAPLREAGLHDYRVALGWLAASLIISVWFAIGLARSISKPLDALDIAVRELNPEVDRKPPKPAAPAPREVLVIFEHLAAVEDRLRSSYDETRRLLHQGEHLRHELVRVIENREQEIQDDTAQLKLANATLGMLSRIDALTGVANRRGFSEHLDQAWRAALRGQRPISLLMIDIDHFKAYNDTYGHQEGDACIKAVVEVMLQIAGRGDDLIARYGGEEFVIVLSGATLDGALQVGEQLRAAVQALGIPNSGAPKESAVTISVGVASIFPTSDVKPDSCLAAADRALYAAKRRGRNQVAHSRYDDAEASRAS